MSKNICLCGNNHETETPLVITITACPTKDTTTVKHKPKGSRHSPAGETSADANRYKNQKNEAGMTTGFEKRSSDMNLGTLRFCDDNYCPAVANGDTRSTRSQSKPWDLGSMGGRYMENKKIQSQDPKPRTEEREWVTKKDKREKGVGSSPKASGAVQTSKVDTCSNIASELRLPVLTPRYHGQGCAIEVDIMEKHDKKCSYKKKKNPERIPTDDRSGSYEVIGRLVFKTCQDGRMPMAASEAIRGKCRLSLPDSPFTTIYSVLNEPFLVGNHPNILPNSTKSDRNLQALETYLKRKRVIESLAKSSKSFPTNLQESSMEFDKFDTSKKEEPVPSLTSYDLEEVFISQHKTNKSVQISDSCFNQQKQKKWFYFLLPCLYSNESYSSLLLCSEGNDVD